MSKRSLQELNEPLAKKLRFAKNFDRLNGEENELELGFGSGLGPRFRPELQAGFRPEFQAGFGSEFGPYVPNGDFASIEILNDDALIKVFEFLPMHVWIRSERVCRRYVKTYFIKSFAFLIYFHQIFR